MIKTIRKTLIMIATAVFFIFTIGTSGFAAGMVPDQAPAGSTAQPTSSAVFINGKQVSFRAYNIKDYNYFKLRDLAKALSGSDKQFEIAYAAVNNAISITTGKAYTPVGGELTAAGDTAARTALVSKATVTINGVKVALSAYLIDGYNYYKLRDIAAAVGFAVSFDSAGNSIQIGTGSENTEANSDALLAGAWRVSLPVQDAAVPSYLYLIFTEDGRLTQFIGTKVATYTADSTSIRVTKVKVMSSDTYGYKITSGADQTLLTIDSNQFGTMTRSGAPEESGAGVIPGLWLSRNSIYNSNTYFYFTKDGSILLGVTLNGTYTLSASGDSYTHNITQDGSMVITGFRITEADGVTQLVTTDSEGKQTTYIKE
jgi:hypothetical protein